MKTQLKGKSATELRSSLTSARREQFKLRLIKAGGEMTSTHPIKQTRREIARLLTALAQLKESTEQEGKA